jgi:hypothetical protein
MEMVSVEEMPKKETEKTKKKGKRKETRKETKLRKEKLHPADLADLAHPRFLGGAVHPVHSVHSVHPLDCAEFEDDLHYVDLVGLLDLDAAQATVGSISAVMLPPISVQ